MPTARFGTEKKKMNGVTNIIILEPQARRAGQIGTTTSPQWQPHLQRWCHLLIMPVEDRSTKQIMFRDATEALGTFFFVFRSIYEEKVDLSWQVKPKVHATLHLPGDGDLINPRAVHNYCEESLMGRVADIWASCANGPYQAKIGQQPLIKHVVAWLIDMGL